MLRPTCLYAFAAVSFLLAGCGSSSPSSLSYQPASAHVPSCAHAGKAIDLPAGFPKDFPLPSGTTITATGKAAGNATTIAGFIPRDVDGAYTFLAKQIPDAGYTLRNTEEEQPHDAEGEFEGNGYVGRFTLHELQGCPQAVTFEAAAARGKKDDG